MYINVYILNDNNFWGNCESYWIFYLWVFYGDVFKLNGIKREYFLDKDFKIGFIGFVFWFKLFINIGMGEVWV